MTRSKIYLGVLILILALGLFVGCASIPLTHNVLSNQPVLYISTLNADSSKVGVLSDTIYLGFFGSYTTFPSVADTAKAGGITKIATIEYYKKRSFLGIFYTKYTTIVTGN